MAERATATCTGTSWDEHTISEAEGSDVKVSRAAVTNRFAGEIDGDGTLEYVIMYRDDGSAAFVGAEHVVGRIGGRAGGFVVQHAGEWIDGTAHSTVTIVPGTGTGDLRGIHGEGRFVARHGEAAPELVLDYGFDA